MPTNYILMFAFTFCEAYTVAFICASVNNSLMVVQAMAMTAAVVLGLTIYAMVAKHDFTVYGGILFIAMAIFFVFSLFSYFFGPTMRLIYCSIGVFIFGFYLIIDTQMIVRRDSKY